MGKNSNKTTYTQKDLQIYADLHSLNSKHTVSHRTSIIYILFYLETFLLILAEEHILHKCLWTFLQKSPYSIQILIIILKRLKVFPIYLFMNLVLEGSLFYTQNKIMKLFFASLSDSTVRIKFVCVWKYS